MLGVYWHVAPPLYVELPLGICIDDVIGPIREDYELANTRLDTLNWYRVRFLGRGFDLAPFCLSRPGQGSQHSSQNIRGIGSFFSTVRRDFLLIVFWIFLPARVLVARGSELGRLG